jgi:hypothetical protein
MKNTRRLYKVVWSDISCEMDIECYRAAIGLFNLCKWNHVRSYKRSCTSILEILLTNFRCTFLVASLIVLQRVNPNIDIVFLLFVLHFTLIIGNVEKDSSLISSSLTFELR